MKFPSSKKHVLRSALCIAVSAAIPLLLVGCKGEDTAAAMPAVGESVVLESGAQLDYENTVFDDFVGGVDSDLWYIGKQAWGSSNGGNGGVIPENVGYTDEGVLVFTGRGNYYTANEVSGVGSVRDGSLTGGAIISKFLTGPGRYEIKMKALPRLGACTAMWVYAYDSEGEDGPENHEIDIELPGGKNSGNQSFNNVLNTNYITEQYSLSHDVNLTDKFGSDTLYSLADGEWHTFGFDWYTDSSDPEAEEGKVVYYVDGVVTAISTNFIPTSQTRLWVGVWFPNNPGFVGSADFEQDYMEVDWVRYTPFVDQPYDEFTPATNSVASLSEYPAEPTVYEAANKISNGTFETALNKSSNGWTLGQVASSTKPVEEECAILTGVGKDGSVGAMVKDGGVLGQSIDTVYDNFTYELTFEAKGGTSDSSAALDIFYRSSVGTLKTETVQISGEEWKTYTVQLTAPVGCMSIQLEWYTDGDGNTVYIDNVSMRRV